MLPVPGHMAELDIKQDYLFKTKLGSLSVLESCFASLSHE